MPVTSSPLEHWFTRHPGPYLHFLGGAAAAAWHGPFLLEALGILPPEQSDWDYALPQGDPELRAVIAKDEGLPHSEHVLLTNGASEANFLALFSLLEAGDEVILQAPLYPQFACLVEAVGARIIEWLMPEDRSNAITPEYLPHLLSPQTRLVVINSPHNPTGRTVTATQLHSIANCVRAHPRAHLLIDEVYRDVGSLSDDKPRALTCLGPERVLISQAVSKSWALPGARVGWLAGDKAVVERAVAWREHLSLALPCPSIGWVKALWPHRGRIIQANQEILCRNRNQVALRLSAAPHLQWQTSELTGVGLLSVTGKQANTFSALQFARSCFERDRVLIVPGDLIGFPGRLRLGYGHRSQEPLAEALDYIVERLECWPFGPEHSPGEMARHGLA